MTQPSDKDKSNVTVVHGDRANLVITGSWEPRRDRDGREIFPPTDQCDRAIGQGLGYFIRCSLPITHTGHHIAFGRTTDTQAVTWVRDDIHETIVPAPTEALPPMRR